MLLPVLGRLPSFARTQTDMVLRGIQAASASSSETLTKMGHPAQVRPGTCRRRSSTSRYACPTPLRMGMTRLTCCRQSIPLSFKAMFHQYFQMANRIRKHYLSPRVLLCLLTGKYVPPIDRRDLYSLQYSMLPARRATVGETWRAINVEIPTPPGKAATVLPNIRPLPNGGRRNGKARVTR